MGFPNGGQVIDRRISMAVSAALALVAGLILPAGGLRQSAVAAPPAGTEPAARPARSPLAPGPVPDLDIAFTAQANGWIEPCG